MTLDVAARLAEGRASVTNTQIYVSACHALGYQHPYLTAHGGQIIEWYCAEDGLDLNVLDADCAVLRAAGAVADEAVRVCRDGLTAVSAEWHGESGSVAIDFIERHCAAGVAVAGALRVAAETCEALRDRLWRLVDEKTAAAMSIDDRRASERPVWLAAAGTVTSGGAARTEATQVVTQQITPYVDTDIRTEWISAMRSATASVSAAYRDAVQQLNSSPISHFDVPGSLGAPPPPAPVPAPTVLAAATPIWSPAPAAGSVQPPPVAEPEIPAPPPPVADSAAVQPLPPAPPVEPPVQPGLDAPAAAGMPSMPDIGGGLSGLVGQIADALGGLFDGMSENPADNPPEVDDPVDKGESNPDDAVDPDIESAEEPVPEEDPVAEETTMDENQAADTAPATDAGLTEPEPPPPPPSPPPTPPTPPPPADEQSAEQTPCEIAADELPQVGQ